MSKHANALAKKRAAQQRDRSAYASGQVSAAELMVKNAAFSKDVVKSYRVRRVDGSSSPKA